mmetsp:Transcript_30344/g.97694  ORF Transcript_30344/g.97694 Transcript_30344/m.97694 type:complete len:107 (-) Transcript_30344:726-1046(-)
MNEHCPAQPHPEAERRAVLDGNPGWQHSESMQRLLCVGVGLICASMVFSTLMVWRTLFELSWGPFKVRTETRSLCCCRCFRSDDADDDRDDGCEDVKAESLLEYED